MSRSLLRVLARVSVFSCLSLFAAVLSAQPAQMGVSPSRFELSLDDGPETESFRVFNYGEEPMGVSLSIFNWELDEDMDVRLLPPDEQSLDQWLVVNPVNFVVPAGGSQVVRFAVRPRQQPTEGEHRAIIYLDQLKSQRALESSLSLRFRVGMAVYAYAGEIERRGELHDIRIEDGGVGFDISSLGNAHVRLSGQFSIWPADEYPGAQATTALERLGQPDHVAPEPILEAGFLPGKPVLPGSRRTVRFRLDEMPPGEYVLDLNGALGDDPLQRGVRFRVDEDRALRLVPDTPSTGG